MINGAIAIVLGASLVLAVLGWRGPWVDRHPRCRRCRYDLHGAGETSVAPGTCPECGASLDRRRAVRHGRRRRRPRVLVTAACLFLVAAAGSAIVIGQHRGAFDVNQFKPVWWLLADASSGGDGMRRALDELKSRLDDGELSAAHVRSITALALELQADRSGPWHHQWGQLFLDARARGLVSDADLDRFLRQGLDGTASLAMRPMTRKGRSASYQVQFSDLRGVVWPFPFEPEARFQVNFGDGEEWWALPDPGMPGSSGGGMLKWNGVVSVPDLPFGEHDMKMRATLQLRRDGRDDPITSKPFEMTRRFTLVGPDEPATRLRRGPGVDAAVRSAITIDQLSINRTWNQRSRTYRARPWMHVQVAETLPVDASVAFFFVVQGEEPLAMGRQLLKVGEARDFEIKSDRPLPDADAELVSLDIIVRTDHRGAEGRLEIEEIWDGEIVLEDVPVTPMSQGSHWRPRLAGVPVDDLKQRLFTETAAITEIIRRLDEDDGVPDEVIAWLAAEILERQAGDLLFWVPEWGDVLETARRKGRVSRDVIDRYLEQALAGMTMSLSEIGPSRWGESRIDYEVTYSCRAAASSRSELVLLAWFEAEIDGEPEAVSMVSGAGQGSTLSTPAPASRSFTTEPMAPGRHTIAVTGHFGVIEPPQGRRRVRMTEADRAATIARVSRRIETEFEVVPVEDVFELVEDEAMRPQIVAAIEFDRPVRVRHDPGGRPRVEHGVVVVDTPPLGVAFEIFLRHGEREWKVGWVLCRPNERDRGRLGSSNVFRHDEGLDRDIEKVDVVFRTNEDMPRGKSRPYRYWKGEIVFEDVPVQHEWEG